MAPANSTARKQVDEPAAALPHRPAQHRGGAGAAGRDPRQQRGVLPRLRFPGAAAFLRADPSEDLRDRRAAHPRRQDRDAGHAQDLPRQPTPTSAASPVANISRASPPKRPPSSTREDYGRTIYDLSIRRAADHDRRGHGQRRLRRAGRLRAARADRGRRAPALRARRDRPLRRRLPALRAGAHHRRRHGGATPISATASCPASPPASTISTA